MFSVVIPTMGRYKPFWKFAHDLCHFELVDEILIIDNDKHTTAKYREGNFSRHKKIHWLGNGVNMFVNPAWNIGVAEAKNEKLAILNDDFIFDLRVFYRVDDRLNDTTCGVIGTAPGDHPNITGQPAITTGEINIIPHTTEHLWGFGYAMFMNKKHYDPIPEDMKIFCGDNWIFDGCRQKGLRNHIITNFLWNTPGSATVSGTIANEFGERDKALYAKYNTERRNHEKFI